jgi:hypothetical protein
MEVGVVGSGIRGAIPNTVMMYTDVPTSKLWTTSQNMLEHARSMAYDHTKDFGILGISPFCLDQQGA